ncbi:MAG: ABC transporter substrate-binding protein [Muribaculaceae bacterium]|nr:ABC transporter substrate-binding protein [Alistipes senegalensis]MCM1472886.1 ABC transporter substrate-binding protein [Muribaculaceae bacterium]
MKKIKKMLTGIIAVSIVMTPAVSCSADKSHKAGSLSIPEETTTTETTAEEITTTASETATTKKTTAKKSEKATSTRTTKPLVAEPETEPETVQAQDYGERADIGGTEIVWLSDYDLNAQVGQKRPTPVALFEDIYGGKIRYVQTSLKNKYNTFSAMLLSGEQLDMVEYEQGTFPNGVLSQQYQPLDPYFRSMGLNYDIWENMEEVIDALAYKGEHYIIPYSFSNPIVLMYSRKLIRDYGLDDPYELYKNDQWNWDTFLNISETYRSKTGKAAVRGGKFGDALIHSTGFRIIGSKNGKLVNNINHAPLRYAELFLQELGRKSLYSSNWNESFSTETLFFATESWILGTENVKNSGMDLMIVPVPKQAGTEGNYITCDFDAKMLVKNSTMGDAVATYIMCERIVASQPEYKAGAKTYATTPVQSSSGVVKSYITAEQYDALQTYLDPAITMPMFDYIWSMNDPNGVMNGLSNSFLINGGYESDWKNLRNSYYNAINQMINEY